MPCFFRRVANKFELSSIIIMEKYRTFYCRNSKDIQKDMNTDKTLNYRYLESLT